MKVLYVGVYRDGGGWSTAAENYLLALDRVGIQVVPRPLKLNNVNHQPHPRILELEKQSATGCDIVIQHVLPHQLSFDGQFERNIALYATETSNFTSSVWAERINAMDEAWVPNKQAANAAKASGVFIPVQVVNHCFDINQYMRSYPQYNELKAYKHNGDFLFYFVGELVKRKNFPALLQAFHSEFSPDEPVQLVLKVNQSGASPQEVESKTLALTEEVKENLKLHSHRYDYKREILITHRLNEQEMFSLHASCDCFVATSYGEAWCQPCFDAMAMGRCPIVPASSGFLEYMSDNEGWLVPVREEPCYGATDTFADIATANENWWSIDVLALRRAMREAFEEEGKRKEKSLAGIQKAYAYSYEVVGAHTKRLLENDGRLERRTEGGSSRLD